MSAKANLRVVWSCPGQKRRRAYSVPCSVRLIPRVDCQIQDLREDFPHLTQTQIINDLLLDSLERLERSRS